MDTVASSESLLDLFYSLLLPVECYMTSVYSINSGVYILILSSW